MDQPKFFLWQLFVTSIPRAPWRGFFFGLFLPLLILQFSGMFHINTFGLAAALAVCVIFCIVDTLHIKKLSLFPVITFFMISTQFCAYLYAAKHSGGLIIPLLVRTADNLVIAVFFLGSLFTRIPLILALLDENTLQVIPEQIRRSSYYRRGWQMVTLLWGVLYVVQPLIFVLMNLFRLSGKEIVDYILGWPLVALFLVLSVMLPRWYWTKNMQFIEEENQR